MTNENIESFINYFRGRTQGWGFVENESIERLEVEMRNSLENIYSARTEEVIEMVEERIQAIPLDYPDTEEGKQARYENSCRVAELKRIITALRSSGGEDKKT